MVISHICVDPGCQSYQRIDAVTIVDDLLVVLRPIQALNAALQLQRQILLVVLNVEQHHPAIAVADRDDFLVRPPVQAAHLYVGQWRRVHPRLLQIQAIDDDFGLVVGHGHQVHAVAPSHAFEALRHVLGVNLTHGAGDHSLR